MILGTILLKLRKARRLSQAEIAEHIGVCQSAYCAWESGRVTPNARHYRPLAALFGVEISALMPNSPPTTVSALSTDSSHIELSDLLIKNQQETIALQKQRIEYLEIENKQLQQIITATTLVSNTLISITFAGNFISFLL